MCGSNKKRLYVGSINYWGLFIYKKVDKIMWAYVMFVQLIHIQMVTVAEG